MWENAIPRIPPHPFSRSSVSTHQSCLPKTRIRGSHVFFAIVVRAEDGQVRVIIGEFAAVYDGNASGGLFLTHDPARQFPNPYAYGPWDPINGTDPTGAIFGIDDALFWGIVITSAVVGAAASGIQAAVNGASVGQAFGAAAIGGVTGGAMAFVGLGIVGLAGAAAGPWGTWGAVAVLTAGGGYSTAESFRSGQYVMGSVGAVFTALGVYGLAQGPNALYASLQGEGAAQGGNGAGGLSQGEQLGLAQVDYDQKFLPADNQFAGPGAPPGPENPYAPYDQPLGDRGPGQIDLQLRVKTSAYDNCKLCTGKSPGDPAYGITKSGFPTAKGAIAADPRYYLPGTRVNVPGYGPATVIDTGGAIKGPFRMDLWFPTHQQALLWGRQELTLTVRIPRSPLP
jgi:3D (Asp-Asp-Asp) domain-containing protein